MTRKFLVAGVLLAVGLGGWSVRSSGPIGRRAIAGVDNTCGPRCVQRVLTLYGLPEESLVDLVREMQGAPSRPAAFSSLQAALIQRGLRAEFVSVGPLTTPSFPAPSIAHLDGDHFVVLESCDLGSALVWDAAGQPESWSWLELRGRVSGVMLATARPGDEVQFRQSWARPAEGLVALGALGLGLVAMGAALIRRGATTEKRAGRV